LKTIPALDSVNPLLNFVQSRMNLKGQGAGLLSRGSLAMSEGITAATQIRDRIINLPGNYKSKSDEGKFIEMLGSMFANGVTRSGFLNLGVEYNIDTHDPASAKSQPEALGKVGEKLLAIFDALRDTPFDSTRSLWDVTTVMFATEFSRTTRNLGVKIDETGTNHNSLTNSMWVGGKGIRGGCVFGASDATDEKFIVSKAHRSVDSDLVKLMGKPFDFVNGIHKDDLPDAYDPSHYLNVASVVNTIYSLFNVPVTSYRSLVRAGPPAPVLKQLLI
jgi:hypothetical protein